ncbi:hypothetical protein CVT24_011546 [Panaeolus cyanescens]|uniref:Uncharacterized protein n=1 Tax=Panaeolus cyanescens TaxID=181874 RepID=A0A409VM97_9AGAR|nr:hypothetical protein CVT24_011546 [Panaeolus cyanescens]
MDSKIAQTHTHTSNRAKKKDGKDKNDKKVVFKGVLDTPFRITWCTQSSSLYYLLLVIYLSSILRPSMSINSQVSILDELLQSLREIVASTPHNHVTARKRKRTSVEQSATGEDPQPIHKGPQPDLTSHFIIGINSVTRRLESDLRRLRVHQIPEATKDPTSPLKCIFVCRADVNPSLIIDHLPHLVAAYNSRQKNPVLLVPLPEGAEQAIAQTLGVRRAAVLALNSEYRLSEKVNQLLQTVPPLRASWLSGDDDQQSLIPTHTKHLRTTAPRDMKAAKILRNEQRSRAKRQKLDISTS